MTSTAGVAPFLDFRKIPAVVNGTNRGAWDLADLPPGEARSHRFLWAISQDPGEGGGVIRAVRDADGGLTVTAEPEQFEPVLEGEQVVGLRFPGCDRYPWQPYDPERDA